MQWSAAKASWHQCLQSIASECPGGASFEHDDASLVSASGCGWVLLRHSSTCSSGAPLHSAHAVAEEEQKEPVSSSSLHSLQEATWLLRQQERRVDIRVCARG